MADTAALPRRRAAEATSAQRHIGPPRRASRWYSRLVAVLKITFPVVALALTVIVFAWPEIFPAVNRLRQSLTAIAVEELANSRMVNPRFRGIDDQGQPFSLSADVATPSATDPDVTDLVRPRGDLSRNDGSWIAITGDEGTYDRAARQLELTGRVNVFHDQGYEVQTTRMHFDMVTSIVEGDQPVAGQGPDTEFQATGFRIEDRGARVFLTGDSRLIIYNQASDGGLGLPDIPTSAAPPPAGREPQRTSPGAAPGAPPRGSSRESQ